jgi:predicted acylesterase/phospholipase RssA
MGAQLVIGVSVGFHDGQRGAPTNIFQVVSRALSAAQKYHTESWENHADLVLHPDVRLLAWDDFARIDEAIEAGAAEALSALPRIKRLYAAHTYEPSEFGKQGEILLGNSLQ